MSKRPETMGSSKALDRSATGKREVKLGRYRVIRRIGKGGMGEVYLGHDDSLNRQVALKVMSRKLTDDENFVSRFKREAQAAAAVSHANLVQIHELNETKGFHFFCMEFVEGENLEEVIAREGHLPSLRALDIIEQAAKGLRAAARKGLIHRDIKPSNIMLNLDGVVKLTDFGLSKALQDSSNLTRTDVILGTPHYVSPEQARGEKGIDFRSDMYSLGVTLFEALTGRTPFDAETPMGVMLRHVNDTPPSVSEIRPSLAPAVVSLVDRLLEKSPTNRFASYDELIAAIGVAKQAVRDSKTDDAPPMKRPLVATTGTADQTNASSPALPPDDIGSAATVVAKKTPSSEVPAATQLTSSGQREGSLADGDDQDCQPTSPETVSLVDAKADAVAAAAERATLALAGMRFPPFGGISSAAWAVIRHPSQTWSTLKAQDSLEWAPIIKYGAFFGFISAIAKCKAIADLLFILPILTFFAPSTHPHGRFKAAFYTVVLCWACNFIVLFYPLILLWYPYVLFRGITDYTAIEGTRRYLIVFVCWLFVLSRVIPG